MHFSPEAKSIIKKVLEFSRARRKKLYIVGGVLRDIIISREKENLDIDFAIKGGAINFGRSFSRSLKAGFVVLDKEHGSCRVVIKTGEKIYTLDFTDFRGKDIDGDLFRRDFSINSLALDLKEALERRDFSPLLIDPWGGLSDIKTKTIRTVYNLSFDEDPLRILRVFSFSSLLGFKIERQTLSKAKHKKKKLRNVSPERIRDELFKIFESDRTFSCINELDELKILEIVLPEIKVMRKVGQGPYHHLDVWSHTLEALKQLDALFKELEADKKIACYLNELISSGRKRKGLLKFAALLHDIGKPATRKKEKGKLTFYGHESVGYRMAKAIAQNLRLSNEEINSLKKIIFWHLRPGYLAGQKVVTARARFKFFRDTSYEAVSVLLLSIADQRATRGPKTTRKSRLHQEKLCLSLIGEYFREQEKPKAKRVVNGNDLMRYFKLAPSPLIGKLLREIEELQAVDKIKTKAQGLAAAKRFIKPLPLT